MSEEKKEYLGDGVYICIEYGQFKITTEYGIYVSNEIILEQEVAKKLIKYINKATGVTQ